MNRRIIYYLSFFFLIGQLHSQQYGGWIRADSLHFARSDHSSLKLPNGNILVTGGYQDTSILAECEIFDVVNNYWMVTSSMQIPRYMHHSALLNKNNVLVIGGYKNKTCEIFDIDSAKWSFTDSTNFPRDIGSTISLLDNNCVLLVGGYYFSEDNSQAFYLDSCEIYDPIPGKWTVTGPLNAVRENHTATKLLNGNVLVTGGANNQAKELRSCELYDVQSGTWSFVDSLNEARMYHSSILLPNGKVLVAGGEDYDSPQGPWLKSCEVYDPELNEWTLVNDLGMRRSAHYSILLDNQKILFAGGGFGSGTWEIYDINTYHSEYIDNFPFTKEHQTANLLNDGRVLSIGGWTWIDSSGIPFIFHTNACEIYDPNLSKLNECKISEVKKFTLKQNYPNPFNPTTKIKFSIGKADFVKISVYNTLGQKVKTLINEFKNPGTYEVQFDATNLPSGIYYYRFESGSFTKVNKMIVLK